jgi:hypothetical protein
MKALKTERLEIRIDEQTHGLIERYTQKTGLTKTKMVDLALRDFLNRKHRNTPRTQETV